VEREDDLAIVDQCRVDEERVTVQINIPETIVVVSADEDAIVLVVPLDLDPALPFQVAVVAVRSTCSRSAIAQDALPIKAHAQPDAHRQKHQDLNPRHGPFFSGQRSKVHGAILVKLWKAE
jgi:hypothetical protein